MVETTGGFTTQTGKAVLVTPSGKIVGSAQLPRGSRGSSARRRLIRQAEEEKKREEGLERAKKIQEAREKEEQQKQLIILEEMKKASRIKQGIKKQEEKKALTEKISLLRKNLEQSVQKEKEIKKEKNKLTGLIGLNIPSVREGTLTLTTIGETLVNSAVGTVAFTKALASALRRPSEFKDLGKETITGIKEDAKDTVKILQISPSAGIAKIGSQIYFARIMGKTAKITKKAGGRVANALDPKFQGVKNIGDKIRVTSTKGKTVNLTLAGRIGSKTLPRETLKQKALREGTTPTAISTQADRLLTIIKRKKKIKKPVVKDESLLTTRGKKLLKKFDNQKISKAELIELDTLVKEKGSKGILERSFFADPEGRIRPSRSGTQEEAGLKDILKGDFTFRTPKPQILLFDDIPIEKFPKELRPIYKKLKLNKQLTQKESKALLQFQLKRSGKFKPGGFLSGEPEITLAPGEIIKRKKVVARIRIGDKTVPIVRATVIKPSKLTKKLLEKQKKGKIKSSEVRTLKRRLQKETGFKTKISSGKRSTKVFPKSKITRALSSIPSKKRKVLRKRLSNKKSSSKKTSKKSPRETFLGGSRPGSITKTSPKKTSKSLTSKGKSLTSKKMFGKSKKFGMSKVSKKRTLPKRSSIIRRSTDKKVKLSKKKLQAYIVEVKRKGKFVRVGMPVDKNSSKDLLAHTLDNTLSRTGRIRSIGKRSITTLPPQKKGYFNKIKNKLRPYKIKQGTKKRLVQGFIEKKGRTLDKKNEVLQLQKARKMRGTKVSKKKKSLLRKLPTKKKMLKNNKKTVKKNKKR